MILSELPLHPGRPHEGPDPYGRTAAPGSVHLSTGVGQQGMPLAGVGQWTMQQFGRDRTTTCADSSDVSMGLACSHPQGGLAIGIGLERVAIEVYLAAHE